MAGNLWKVDQYKSYILNSLIVIWLWYYWWLLEVDTLPLNCKISCDKSFTLEKVKCVKSWKRFDILTMLILPHPKRVYLCHMTLHFPLVVVVVKRVLHLTTSSYCSRKNVKWWKTNAFEQSCVLPSFHEHRQ